MHLLLSPPPDFFYKINALNPISPQTFLTHASPMHLTCSFEINFHSYITPIIGNNVSFGDTWPQLQPAWFNRLLLYCSLSYHSWTVSPQQLEFIFDAIRVIYHSDYSLTAFTHASNAEWWADKSSCFLWSFQVSVHYNYQWKETHNWYSISFTQLPREAWRCSECFSVPIFNSDK